MEFEFYAPQEFTNAVKQLRGLFGESQGFQETTARKDHVDIFDQPIQRGEIHFNRTIGGFGNEIELARKSMEKLCGAIFFENRFGAAIAAKVTKDRDDKTATFIQRLEDDEAL